MFCKLGWCRSLATMCKLILANAMKLIKIPKKLKFVLAFSRSLRYSYAPLYDTQQLWFILLGNHKIQGFCSEIVRDVGVCLTPSWCAYCMILAITHFVNRYLSIIELATILYARYSEELTDKSTFFQKFFYPHMKSWVWPNLTN